MPVSYVGATSTVSESGGNSFVTINSHGSEQTGHLLLQAWWLPTDITSVTPSRGGWTFLLERDTSIGPFALWLAFSTSENASVRWDWNATTREFGGVKLIVSGADTTNPFQVGPLLSGADTGQTLSLPSMTPLEAGGMAVHWLTARYSSAVSSKSIGTVTGHTMSTALSGGYSGAGHAVRFARRDNVPANTATGALSTTATATTTGWRVLSGVLREPRPWTPQNKQFHTHA